MVSNEFAIVMSVLTAVAIVGGAIAIYEIGRKDSKPETKEPSQPSRVTVLAPQYHYPRYGRPYPDPHVSAMGSKWGAGLWDHRRPPLRGHF